MRHRSDRFVLALASTLAFVSIACARASVAPTPPACTEAAASTTKPPASSITPPTDPEPSPPAEPAATAPAHDMAAVLLQANTPPELAERMAAAGILDAHALDASINPFYLRGDFDGDERPDYLVSVVRKDAPAGPPSPRLVVLRGVAAEDAAVWLDEDATLSLPARDGWYVHAERTKVPVGFDGSKPPRLVGDAFVMMKAESSSALVYWTGKRFASHWLSD